MGVFFTYIEALPSIQDHPISLNAIQGHLIQQCASMEPWRLNTLCTADAEIVSTRSELSCSDVSDIMPPTYHPAVHISISCPPQQHVKSCLHALKVFAFCLLRSHLFLSVFSSSHSFFNSASVAFRQSCIHSSHLRTNYPRQHTLPIEHHL